MSPRHKTSPEHHHRFLRFKDALGSIKSSTAMALLSRIRKCGGPDWGYRYTCRSPACPACRDRYIGAQRRLMLKRFKDVPVERLALVSIILGATRQVEEIGTIVGKGRKDARNMFDGGRRDCGLWAPAEIVAWIETDAFAAENFAHLGPDRRALIGELISLRADEEGAVWVPSMHGIVHLGPGLDIGRVREALERQWPGHRRVDLQPFYADVGIATSVGNIVNYGNKHACTTDYYDQETGEITPVEWETSWVLTYYTWLHGWSRGFHSLRVSINPKKFKSTSIPIPADVDIEEEPLPFIHGFSVFHTDRYYWI